MSLLLGSVIQGPILSLPQSTSQKEGLSIPVQRSRSWVVDHLDSQARDSIFNWKSLLLKLKWKEETQHISRYMWCTAPLHLVEHSLTWT